MAKNTKKNDLAGLTLLGEPTKPVRKLETFPNHNDKRDYVITLQTEEFTCVLP